MAKDFGLGFSSGGWDFGSGFLNGSWDFGLGFQTAVCI